MQYKLNYVQFSNFSTGDTIYFNHQFICVCDSFFRVLFFFCFERQNKCFILSKINDLLILHYLSLPLCLCENEEENET